jgi:signal transduction histidine kinase
VELVVRLETPLWLVTCDPASVERAILNLALNARDAMPGGGRLTLASANVEVDQALVSAHPFMRRGPNVRLTVADSGSGMTPEVKAHAFEPFFTTKPRGQGVGLGLAAAYGMVKQSGGFIVLESEPGRGTNLDLYFSRSYQGP